MFFVLILGFLEDWLVFNMLPCSNGCRKPLSFLHSAFSLMIMFHKSLQSFLHKRRESLQSPLTSPEKAHVAAQLVRREQHWDCGPLQQPNEAAPGPPLSPRLTTFFFIIAQCRNLLSLPLKVNTFFFVQGLQSTLETESVSKHA